MKYDASTTVRCPECDEDVSVGTAGPAGIIQHQGKKPCKKARQAKEEKGKIRTLFQLGVKKVKALLLETASTSSDKDRPHNHRQSAEGASWVWKLIAELMAAAEWMGLGVPITTESDELSGFGRVRAEAECMDVPDDEIWEIVNPELDRLLGFGKSAVELESIVRRGD